MASNDNNKHLSTASIIGLLLELSASLKNHGRRHDRGDNMQIADQNVLLLSVEF